MKLKILRAKLLDPVFFAWVKEKYPDTKLLEEDVVIKNIKEFEIIWQKIGNQVASHLEESFGLKFKNQEYYCFVVNRSNRDISKPLIIRSRYSPEEFILAMTHELTHILFQENKAKISVETLRKIFNVHNDIIARHIPVYAILNKIKKINFNQNGFSLENIEVLKDRARNTEYNDAEKYVLKFGELQVFQKIKEYILD